MHSLKYFSRGNKSRTCAILQIFKDGVSCYAIFIKIHIQYTVLSNLVIRSFLGRGWGGGR